MKTPNYGNTTLCRPLVTNVPDPPEPGAEVVLCEWCGQDCWKRPIEPNPLPKDMAPACTACALYRAKYQRLMDEIRYRRELLADEVVGNFEVTLMGNLGSGRYDDQNLLKGVRVGKLLKLIDIAIFKALNRVMEKK